jgi:hypothetical protein
LPTIVGGDALFGAAASVTTSVGFEFAVDEPSAFVAVTRTISVCPVSAAATSYVWSVALEIEMQAAPFSSQRSHWYVYFDGLLPQTPLPADSVFPTAGRPPRRRRRRRRS